MATTLSDYAEVAAINHILGTSAWTMPAAPSLALFTVNPNFETGAGGTEATGGSYARKSVIFTTASGAGGSTTGPTAQKVWTVGTDIAAGTYTGWAIYDAASGGNMLFGDAFSANRVLSTTGDTLTFAAGSISFSLT